MPERNNTKRGALTARGARAIGWGREGTPVLFTVFKDDPGMAEHVYNVTPSGHQGARVAGILSVGSGLVEVGND